MFKNILKLYFAPKIYLYYIYIYIKRWTTSLHVYNIFYNLLSHHIKLMLVIDLTIDK